MVILAFPFTDKTLPTVVANIWEKDKLYSVREGSTPVMVEVVAKSDEPAVSEFLLIVEC